MNKVTAIILAAGESRRMGQPKLLLPWGGQTILGSVIETVQEAGVNDIVVVTGGVREKMESVCALYPIRSVYNPQHKTGGMVSSIQCGIGSLTQTPPREISSPAPIDEVRKGALICLGDQPQIQANTVRRMVAAFNKTNQPLIIPSYRTRRGHPWLVDNSLWSELMDLLPSQSPRDFLALHENEIFYVRMKTNSILHDLDTPEEYERQKPKRF